MTFRVLNEGEWLTIINALYSAAETYRKCAEDVRKTPMAGLGDQFDKQVAEVRAILEKIED